MLKRELSRTYGLFLKFWMGGTLHHKATKDTKGHEERLFFWRNSPPKRGMSNAKGTCRPGKMTKRIPSGKPKGRQSTFWWDEQVGFGGMRGIPRDFCEFW